MKPSIIIIGAGGHGKVVYDAIVAQNKFEVTGFVDSQLKIGTKVIGQVEVICAQENVASLVKKAEYFIVAIGNNIIRAQVYDNLVSLFKPATIIHPLSVIGSEVTIGDGTVVLAYAIINVLSKVGSNSIINAGVIIDHECEIGNNVYLKLGAIIVNNSRVLDFHTSEIGQIINS
jgi:sugar O-acyltransferase (sialic acid O-acetyltransferase NeuD family)